MRFLYGMALKRRTQHRRVYVNSGITLRGIFEMESSIRKIEIFWAIVTWVLPGILGQNKSSKSE